MGGPENKRDPSLGATDGLPVVFVSQTTRSRLIIVHTPDREGRGRTALLGASELVIGRSPPSAAGLAIDDSAISRSHAVLRREDGTNAWSVGDLGSRNGTFVDGLKVVDGARLTDGSVIRVGGTILLFEILTVRAGEPLEPERAPILGPSLAMQRVRGQISLVAGRPVPVLLLGESGVGKDVAAEAIHRRSGSQGPFVPVNCGALPEALVESEMFGHAAGAFTGALKRNEGLFKAADGGTLFLDEVGELPIAAQAKLLRALDRGEVRPVGGSEVLKVNVRVVAATNRDLAGAIEAGKFRGDLFARLNGFPLRIPPLRERREDVLSLTLAFLERAGGAKLLSPDAAEALLLYPWPYNAREVQRVASAASLGAGQASVVELHHLPHEVRTRVEARLPAPEPMTDVAILPFLVQREGTPTRAELELVLGHAKGNIARVAEHYGKDRRQVYRWMERLGLSIEAFRDDDEG